jgi:hypothetical protein
VAQIRIECGGWDEHGACLMCGTYRVADEQFCTTCGTGELPRNWYLSPMEPEDPDD